MGKDTRKRRKARELGAPKAETLIKKVPHLINLLSRDQIEQIQDVLDAAVLNPMYEEAYRKAMKASVIAKAGDLVLRDKTKERRAQRILGNRIHISKNDFYIRVDHNKMLTADALVPVTNNPDEADYLVKVRNILNSKGVWLQLQQPFSARGKNPNVWEFTFTLGKNGDPIATKDALIDRDELFGTSMVGGGYYSAVMTGQVQLKLKRAFEKFSNEFTIGRNKHLKILSNRTSAAPGVVPISDLIGGAKFPDTKIWDRPHKLKLKAMQANTEGDVRKAQVYLLAAAKQVEYNARLLSEYLKKTIGGAESATTMLKVVAAIGAVADAVLLVIGVGAGLKALRAAGGKALSSQARDEAAEAFVKEYAKKNGISEAELAMVRYVKQQPGKTLGTVRGGHSAGYAQGPGVGF